MNGHIFRMQLFREPNTNDAMLKFSVHFPILKREIHLNRKEEKRFEWIYGHE